LIYFSNYSTNGNSLIYQKKLNTTKSLINYWAFNGNVNDSIGNAHLYGGVNTAFTYNRFGQSNTAISLLNGYYRLPPGVYFSGTQLTIMAWVRVRNFRFYSRLIDFGNGPENENIVVALSDGSTGKPYLYLRSGINYLNGLSTKTLNLNQWQHLACAISFPFYSIYIDGIEVTTPGSKTSNPSFRLINVVRNYNYVGRSNWYVTGNQDSDADFDDLKLFNRALTQNEINIEMNNNL
jgi:hypothetical protein